MISTISVELRYRVFIQSLFFLFQSAIVTFLNLEIKEEFIDISSNLNIFETHEVLDFLGFE